MTVRKSSRDTESLSSAAIFVFANKSRTTAVHYDNNNNISTTGSCRRSSSKLCRNVSYETKRMTFPDPSLTIASRATLPGTKSWWYIVTAEEVFVGVGEWWIGKEETDLKPTNKTCKGAYLLENFIFSGLPIIAAAVYAYYTTITAHRIRHDQGPKDLVLRMRVIILWLSIILFTPPPDVTSCARLWH